MLFTFGMLQAAPGGNKNNATVTSNVQLLSGKNVNAGSAITALFQSNNDGEAQITVENLKGKRLLDQNIRIDEGFNLIKLKVAEIPSGFYIIKMKTNGGLQTLPMVVQ